MVEYYISFLKEIPDQVEALRKEDHRLASKMLHLLVQIKENPFEGTGKPEPLKGSLSGFWSRRINEKHRLIYKVVENRIDIISCYGHYNDK